MRKDVMFFYYGINYGVEVGTRGTYIERLAYK